MFDKKYRHKKYSDKDIAKVQEDIIKIQENIIIPSNKKVPEHPILFHGIEFPYEEGTLLDFAFTLDQNTYQGKNSISFIIKDIRLSERDFDTESIMLAVQDYELYRSGILKKHLCSELPSREDFKLIYVFLQRSKRRQFTIDSFLYEFRRFLEKI